VSREYGVHGGPGGLVAVGPDVTVGVEGGLGAGVPEPGLDSLDILSGAMSKLAK
jgi:hypothetical protein